MNEIEADLHRQDIATAARIPDDLAALRDTVTRDEPAFRVWQRDTACALARVEVAWAAHTRADEDPQGFLAAARRDAPRLGHRLDDQLDEHRELADELDALHRRLVAYAPTDDRSDARSAIEEVAARVEAHLHSSDCLAWEIANEDLGSGD